MGIHLKIYYLVNLKKLKKIDESKIICEKCRQENKSTTYMNQFFKCFTCKNNLCPLCKSIHDKTHNIIDYDKENYICDIHCDSYNSYCNNCNKDICIMCEKDHVGHKVVSCGSFMPDKNNLNNGINKLKVKIEELKQNINEIIYKLNELTNNLDIYYKIYSDLIDNYSYKNRNYIEIKNLNDMNDYNNNLIENVNNIIKDKNIKRRCGKIFELYEEMTNKNYIGKRNEQKLKKEKYEIMIINNKKDYLKCYGKSIELYIKDIKRFYKIIST